MKALKIAVVLLLSLTFGISAANAAVFNFDFYNDMGWILSNGSLTTDDAPDEYQMVTSVSGQFSVLNKDGLFDTYAIDGINPGGFNVIDTSLLAAYFSFYVGLLDIDLASGNGVNPSATIETSDFYDTGVLTISPGSVSAVPLPPSLAMFGGALLMLAVFGVGRKNQTRSIAASK